MSGKGVVEILERRDPDFDIEKMVTKNAMMPQLPCRIMHEEPGRSVTEAVASLVEIVASSYAMPINDEPWLSIGGQAQILSVYHAAARKACSVRFAYLRNECDSDGLGAEALRRDPLLQELNGIRLGFKRAMVRSYGEAAARAGSVLLSR